MKFMRRSGFVAFVLSAVTAFCMIPGTLTYADTVDINITVNVGYLKERFDSGEGCLYYNGESQLETNTITPADIDNAITISPRQEIGIGECFAITLDGRISAPGESYIGIWYRLSDPTLRNSGASIYVYVNGMRLEYLNPGDEEDAVYISDNCVFCINDDQVYLEILSNFAGSVDMYRLYNPNSGEHFYTADLNERNYLINLGWNDEGVGWVAPYSSRVPVYRLYNPYGGEHHYTTDINERNGLIAIGWNDEGIGWYSDEACTVPLYRQYNPNAYANNHNYTTSLDENNYLVSLGWRAEDIGWYGVSDEC